jgi:hypothetical protein
MAGGGHRGPGPLSDCPRELADASFARLRAQAPLPARAHPVDGANAYVVCLRDRIVRPSWQESAARTVLGIEPWHLDAGHFGILTHRASSPASCTRRPDDQRRTSR